MGERRLEPERCPTCRRQLDPHDVGTSVYNCDVCNKESERLDDFPHCLMDERDGLVVMHACSLACYRSLVRNILHAEQN
jgi:hypothetical protein